MEEKDEDEGKEAEVWVPGRIRHCSRRVLEERHQGRKNMEGD